MSGRIFSPQSTPEDLRAEIIDIERAHQQEQQLRLEAEGLLEGLRGLTEAKDTQQIFDKLIAVLHKFIPFEDAFMLQSAADDTLKTIHSTSPAFRKLEWKIGPMLRRVLDGMTVLVFDAHQVPDWGDHPEAIRSQVRSAIHSPLRTETQCAMLVFVHSRPSMFTNRHAHFLDRFAPLTNQVLANMEYRDRLEKKRKLVEVANATLSLEVEEHRYAEQKLIKLNHLYAALGATDNAVIRNRDVGTLLQQVCHICVEHGGLALAVAGLVDPAAGRIVPISYFSTAQAPTAEVSPPLCTVSADDPGMFATVIRERKPRIINDFLQSPMPLTWPDVAKTIGIGACAVFPLWEAGRVVGALGLHACEAGYFDEDIVALLVKIVEDVSFALDVFAQEQRRLKTEQELTLKNRAIESSINAIFITNFTQSGNPIEYVNPAFERMTGYTATEITGRSADLLLGHEQDQPAIERIRTAFNDQREAHAILHYYRKDGSQFWGDLHMAPVSDESENVTHFIGIINDVTDAKDYASQLEVQANYDALTGLVNRNLLMDRLSQAIFNAHRQNQTVAVLVIDLDHFKMINDSLGHPIGDQFLKVIADRLKSCVRDGDTVARLSGDEFALVLLRTAPAGNNPDAAQRTNNWMAPLSCPIELLQRILRTISQAVTLANQELMVTCSIGLSLYPQDGDHAESLLMNASAAMHSAKKFGRNNFQLYTMALNAKIGDQLSLQVQLLHALEREEFVLHYQPQADLRSGAIVGVEALVRWQHPQRGLLAPSHFIGMAEEIGLIVPIGAWVLRTACLQAKALDDAGLGHIRMAVNLSVRQFYQHELVASIAMILQETELAPHLLEIELTESLIMADTEHAVGILHALKALGVKLSIDDFGTGYSSLSYLKRFPIDVLKIDQSFVRDITTDPDDATIVASIISLAHALQLQVIAEGVESEAQLAYLQRHGCDEMQGYYFSRPIPADEFMQFLRDGKSLATSVDWIAAPVESLLIVDDEANIAAALKGLLGQDGYRILTATSAAQGFQLLAMHRIQVILCDQRMPVMNGTDFLFRVKDLYPDTIRIMLSDYAELQSLIEAINRGAIYQFFAKPWEDALLRNSVRDAFRHYWLLHHKTSKGRAVAMRTDSDRK